MNWAILAVAGLASTGFPAVEYQRQTKIFEQERAMASTALTEKERQFEQSISEMRPLDILAFGKIHSLRCLVVAKLQAQRF